MITCLKVRFRSHGFANRKIWRVVLGTLACALYFSSGLRAAGLPEKVDFNLHIKPLMSDRCYTCHGPDEKARKAKLRLDTKAGAFKALDEDRKSVCRERV